MLIVDVMNPKEWQSFSALLAISIRTSKFLILIEQLYITLFAIWDSFFADIWFNILLN